MRGGPYRTLAPPPSPARDALPVRCAKVAFIAGATCVAWTLAAVAGDDEGMDAIVGEARALMRAAWTTRLPW